ncbi:hypothetical protein Tco_1372906 [Tanacetum coccineum]
MLTHLHKVIINSSVFKISSSSEYTPRTWPRGEHDNIAKDNKIKELDDKNSWYETELNRKQIYLEECKKDYDKMKKGYDKMKKDNEQMKKDHLNEMDRTKKDNLNGMDLMKKAHTNEMDLVLKRNAELEHHRRL